ncbi:MAG: PAS domain S-box protein [Candidatus Omnitrophica bacterium]|nr:PAS domain S-box protein [Candidatus Omnitrophota bacterium]
MHNFFHAQMDFIFFVYGLGFILLAATSYFMYRVRPEQTFWKWIGLFGLLHGITEWLDMLVLSTGDNFQFKIVRIAFLTLSFLCFVEIVREYGQKRWGKILGQWIYLPLIVVILGSGWMLGSLVGVHIFSRYFFGVLGGLVAAKVIATFADKDADDKRFLLTFAYFLGFYVSTQFFVPRGTFFPSSIINQDIFFINAGFPIQLARMVLALVLAGLAWNEYSQVRRKILFKIDGKRGLGQEFWFFFGFIVIIVAGWIMTERGGQIRDRFEREYLLSNVRVAAGLINSTRIKALTGTEQDITNEHYQRIREQFLNILAVQPEALYVYLFGRKDGKNIFLLDTEPADHIRSSEPLAKPGEIYEQDEALLAGLFQSGGAVTVGPETDKWGTFISGLAAIKDPANGKTIAVLGIDKDASVWALVIGSTRLTPIGMTLLLVLLYLIFFVIYNQEKANKQDAQEREHKLKNLTVKLEDDISKIKKFEDNLRQSEEKIRSITDSAQDAIIMMDPHGLISFWNPAAERILGYSAKEAIGKNLHRFLVHERFHAAHDAAYTEFLRTGLGAAVGKTLELQAIRKDGVEISVDLSLSASKRSDGWHAVGILRDITERKAVEEELLKLTRAVNQSPSSIVITNIRGEIEFVNPKFTQLTGYSAEEALGKNPRVLKSGEISPEGYKKLWDTIISGQEWRGEFHNKKKNGELYWESAAISAIRNAEGKITHYLAIKEDITEFKKQTEEIQKVRKQLDDSQAQLFQAAKLSTLGEMATGIAHEINQPLGGIALVSTMFKKLMEKKTLTDDKVGAGIKDIEMCIERMTKTINHLRSFARQEKMDMKKVDVVDTIDSALILLGEQLRIREVAVIKNIEPDLPKVLGEPHQLEQVWINFITNARDAMGDKQQQIAEGKIILDGYQKKLEISVAHNKQENMLVVSFADNGPGIDDEYKKKVFEPFFTTKEVGKGTGLGLSISYGIIDSHKGRIEIEGKKGEGAIFKVYLPIENKV